jgi:hypothetical protein
MEQKNNFLDENKKRAAFKRFSQMSAAGLAVLSLSAFTDVSAKQLPANVDNYVVKKQNSTLLDLGSDESITSEVPWVFDYGGNYYNYSNNYSNYSNQSYSNNYSNYCNSNN